MAAWRVWDNQVSGSGERERERGREGGRERGGEREREKGERWREGVIEEGGRLHSNAMVSSSVAIQVACISKMTPSTARLRVTAALAT